MGQHTVPQEYLRHFACPSEAGLIWMYDKESARFKKLPVKVVAQASEFYSQDDERLLSERVEGPAHHPLTKVRRADHITADERRSVALYLASMATRGNRAKQEKQKIFDRDGKGMIEAAIRDHSPALLDQEIELFVEKYSREVLADRDAIVKHQWLPEEVATCMESMNWKVLMMNSERLITADHPLWFTERDGLQRPAGELAIPLAPNVALIANWSGPERRTSYIRETSRNAVYFGRFAKEVNRRMVFQAERFLFAHEPWPWLRRMASNPAWNRRSLASAASR